MLGVYWGIVRRCCLVHNFSNLKTKLEIQMGLWLIAFVIAHKVALLRASYCLLAISRICAIIGFYPSCFECVSVVCYAILAVCHWNRD